MAEAISEEELRRRDPVKRAALFGAFLVVLSLVWFSSTWLTYLMAKQNLNHIESEIQTHTNEYALVQNNLKKISDIQKQIDSLDQLAAARFLQGNLMNSIQQTYVPNIQLTRLHIDQSYITTPATAPKPGTTAVARPASVAEHITLFIDARDFSSNPGDQINHYRDALLKQEFLKNYIDPTNGIRLASPTSAVQSSSDSKPYVMFTFECRFRDKTP